MIRDIVNIDDILISFETTLKIDYKKRNIHDIIKSAVESLENVTSVKLDKGIYNAEVENRLISDSVSILIKDIAESLKLLSLLTSVSMFDKDYGQNLASVNYLGFSKQELLAALKYLQDKTLCEERDSFFESIVNATDKLEINTVKRLLVIMSVLEKINMPDAVAILAQYLYIGGLR